MIHEAIDAAYTVAAGLLAWIAVFAAVGTVVLLAGLACGTWAVKRAWRTVHRFAGARRAPGARLRAEVPESVPRLPQPRERRSVPRWALPPDDTPKVEKSSEAA